jgi:dihydroorotate dehydrogenase (fumarate)
MMFARMRIPIANAAGPKSKELPDIEKLLRTPLDAITIGSITLGPNAGNSRQFYWADNKTGATLNSLGLPNKGLAHYQKILPGVIQSAQAKGKRVRVSIAGSHPAEYAALAKELARFDIDGLEINASCPNVWHGTRQRRIPSFDLPLLQSILTQAAKAAPGHMFDIKVSPVSDPVFLSKLCTVLSDTKCVRAVVTSNTFPNALGPNGRLSGLGGTPLRFVALGQVRQLRTLLPKRIKVTGVGGISTRKHIREYAQAGADGVQVGSHYFKHGAQVFHTLIA